MEGERRLSTPEGSLGVPSAIERAFAHEVFQRELRVRQRDAWRSINPSDALQRQAYDRDMATLTRSYIESSGVSPDDVKFQEYYDAARAYSWDRINDDQWYLGIPTGGEWPAPQFAAMYDQQRRLFGRQTTGDGTGYVPPIEDEAQSRPSSESIREQTQGLEELKEQIEAARHEADAAYAERMKAGPLEGKKRRGVIEEGFYEAHQELQRREAAFDDKFIALMRQGGATDEQIAEVVAHGAKERNDHYANSQQDAMIGTGVGGTVRRGLQRYERLGTPAKVAVGLGATALVGVMGVVTGGVMTMAGVAGMAAARGYRTYGLQRAKLYRDAGPTQEIAYKKQDGDVRAAQEILEESRAKERERAKVRIEEGDKIKKRALGLGAAALAVTGVGVAIEHQDELRRLGTNSRILWSYLFDRDINIPDVGVDTEPDQVPDSDPDAGRAEAPDRTLTPVPTLPGGEYVTQGAYEIRTGEGWFRTFSEMGIDNADAQATLLEDRQLMNELRQLKLAYPDSSLGGWGIYQQPNGTMPPAAIDSILRAATRHGISAS